MPDIQVDVTYSGKNDEIAVIEARGFIDTTTAPDLEKKLEEQLALNKYKIVVDLKNIDYVSSAGWGVFVSEIREIRENSGDLVLSNMSPDVYDVYELMEFSSILKSFDSLEEAVAGFTGEQVQKEAAGAPRAIPESPKPPAGPAGAPAQAAETPPSPGTPESTVEDPFSRAGTDLGRRIIQIIIDNPYYEVKEIIKALKLPQYGGRKTKGKLVKTELKTMNLMDKQVRFELAIKGRQ